MKRRLPLLLSTAIVLLAGGAWFFGRAPTRFVLEQESRRFYSERLATEARLTLRIGKLEGSDPLELRRLERDRQRNVQATRTLRIRGWEVLLIPTQAPRPEPGQYLVLAPCDFSGARDHPGLVGPIRIWLRPTGPLARLLRGLGLSP